MYMAKEKKKEIGRGKRYTRAEKVKILTFVDKYNATNGRGGAAEASRKFGVSQLTIGNWLRSAGSPAPKRKKSNIDVDKALKRLSELHKEIGQAEAKYNALCKEYAELKASI